jgi:hypothetical protein
MPVRKKAVKRTVRRVRRNPSQLALNHATSARHKAQRAVGLLRESVKELTEAYIEASNFGYTRSVNSMLTQLNSAISSLDDDGGVIDAIEAYENRIENQM